MSSIQERIAEHAKLHDHAAVIEQACEVMHDAYEAAAAEAGWETQERSRKPWADVPEANKVTMRRAVSALLAHLAEPTVDDMAVDEAAVDFDTMPIRRRDELIAATLRFMTERGYQFNMPAVTVPTSPTEAVDDMGCDECGKPATHVTTPGGFRGCDDHFKGASK